MISFIVIGRNEGKKLIRCFKSILNAVNNCKISNYEMIYVDSNSSDDSISLVQEQIEGVSIYKIIGDTNAAIARNTGANNSKGDTLFFIDGDMDIYENFLPLVYTEENGLIEDFVSGNWMNYYYNHQGEFLNKEKFLELKEDIVEKTTGGLFLVKKEVWNSIGGMKNKYRISEDIDFGLRLAKKSIFLKRKKQLAANHHTISYLDKKRMWKDFFNLNHLYARSLLYREHAFNKHIYKRILRSDYSFIMLLLIIISLFLSLKLSMYLFLVYILILFLRSKFKLEYALFYFLRDITVFLGLFFFKPAKINFSTQTIT